MDPLLHTLFAPLAQDGPQRWAGWDVALFERVCRESAVALAPKLDGQAEPVLAAYLQLLHEANGLGYLQAANFLSHCLVRLVPEQLAQVPAAQRLEVLANIWNIGEGLLREPVWVDRYVVACAGQLRRLADLETFLVQVLEPALAPATTARWQGPFQVEVLDGRRLLDDFLPGAMHLAAPAVLCVHDRRLAGVQVGVFLRPGKKSAFMGLTPCLGKYEEQAPAGSMEAGRLKVGAVVVELPLLGPDHCHVLTRSGFAAASAVDSQRLWIVESP